jgi:hypothetical protein
MTIAALFARLVHALTPSRSTFPDEATLSRGRMRIERERAAQVLALKAAKQGPWAPAATVAKPRVKRRAAPRVVSMRLTRAGRA